MIELLKRRVMGMVGRAVLEAVNDGGTLQMLQVSGMAGEIMDDVERFQEYGFTSHPLPEAEAAIIHVQGLKSHGIVIAVDDRRYRLKSLQPGEVALYDDQEQAVHLMRDGILVKSAFKVTVEAPEVLVDADRVDLGGEGGAAVARVGDPVAGGHITGGSGKVFSA